MELGNSLGIAGLVLALISLGITILWPTKRWIGCACFIVAAVLVAWWAFAEYEHHPSQDQHEAGPLYSVVDTTSLFYSSPNNPLGLPNPVLSSIVTIYNRGTYPTTVSDFWLSVRWKDGEVSKVKATLLARPMTFPYRDGHREMMYPEDDLCEKGLSPISVGGQITGRVMFQDSALNPYRIQNERPKIEISFTDVRGTKYSAFSAIESSAEGTDREFPGMHLRFKQQ
ncbi:MAG TPA: hypothetical protein VGG56_09685 [Terracidiphilus sp.]